MKLYIVYAVVLTLLFTNCLTSNRVRKLHVSKEYLRDTCKASIDSIFLSVEIDSPDTITLFVNSIEYQKELIKQRNIYSTNFMFKSSGGDIKVLFSKRKKFINLHLIPEYDVINISSISNNLNFCDTAIFSKKMRVMYCKSCEEHFL